jgi:hypothetical protein
MRVGSLTKLAECVNSNSLGLFACVQTGTSGHDTAVVMVEIVLTNFDDGMQSNLSQNRK